LGISFHDHFLCCQLLALRWFFGSLSLLFNGISTSSIASPSEITPQYLSLLQVHIKLCSLIRVVQDRVNQPVISHVTKIILIPCLLVFSFDLLPFKLVGAFFAHLTTVKVICFLFFQPIRIFIMVSGHCDTYFFFLLVLKLSMVNVSRIRSSLTFLSSGLSVPNDANAFTSSTRGLSLPEVLLWQRMISNPRTSKLKEFSRSSGWHERYTCWRFGCTEIIVFAMMSCIFSHRASASTPLSDSCCLMCSKTAVKLRLWPALSLS
jgi:hypothetical protein